MGVSIFEPSMRVLLASLSLVLCSVHDAAWVAEIDYPGLNYWLKARLLETTDVGEYASFWLGATTNGRHNPHQPGTWFWPHMNTTVEWSDWADGEPNSCSDCIEPHPEDCLAMWEYHDPIIPWFRDYYWNDVNCDETRHYICQNTCLN